MITCTIEFERLNSYLPVQNMVNYLIYLSCTTNYIGTSDLNNIIQSANHYNPKFNITGILLYHNEYFLQMLEGQESDLNRLFAKIEKDSRHRCLYEPLKGVMSERLFSQWSMGLVDLGSQSAIEKIDQFKEFINYIAYGDNPTESEDILDFLASFSAELKSH